MPLDSPAMRSQGVVVPKARSDVYTTMLFISLIAILIAILCLYLEMRSYNMDRKAQDARLAALPRSTGQPLGSDSWRPIGLIAADVAA